MAWSNGSRLALASLTLLWACARLSPLPAQPAAPDPAAASTSLPEDHAGLRDLANRLCVGLASLEQRALGLRAAERLQEVAFDPADALTLAQCTFLNADRAGEPGRVVALTELGIRAARAADPTGRDPRAAYLLAVNLGLNVRAVGLAALGRVGEVIAALELAAALPAQDLGGPWRVLGMLYLKAPPWPAGPGDLEAALGLLKQAATQYPSHPQNHLFLAEALLEDGDRTAARRELAAATGLASRLTWGDDADRWRAEAAVLAAKLED